MSDKKTPQQVIEHEEYLEDGNVFLYTRNGIFYARVYKGEGTRKYIHRTLKTRNLSEARKRAMKFFNEIQFRKDADLPLQQKTFNDVIDEYLKLRQTQYDRAQLDKINTSRQEQTSIQASAAGNAFQFAPQSSTNVSGSYVGLGVNWHLNQQYKLLLDAETGRMSGNESYSREQMTLQYWF